MFPYLKAIPKLYQDVILSFNKSKILSSEDFHQNFKNQPICAIATSSLKGKLFCLKAG